jgi:hypothetical protein
MSSVFLTAIFLTLAASSPGQLSCPASVNVGPSIADAPAGWEAGVRTSAGIAGHAFSSAAFSIGHPSGLAFLIASGETVRGNETFDQYEFQAATEEKGVWLVCYYSDTPAYVAKRIEGLPKKCESARNASAETAAVCE